jgi:hypothetical protein
MAYIKGKVEDLTLPIATHFITAMTNDTRGREFLSSLALWTRHKTASTYGRVPTCRVDWRPCRLLGPLAAPWLVTSPPQRAAQIKTIHINSFFLLPWWKLNVGISEQQIHVTWSKTFCRIVCLTFKDSIRSFGVAIAFWRYPVHILTVIFRRLHSRRLLMFHLEASSLNGIQC